MFRFVAALFLLVPLSFATVASAQTETTTTTVHRTVRRSHRVASHPEETDVEIQTGRVQLRNDAFVYSRASKWSKSIDRVHAPKFVNVTGSTRNYLQIKLKDGQTGYIVPSAVNLVLPTQKDFILTADAPVYSAPNRFSSRLAEVHSGHNVNVTGLALNYLKIRMKSGVEGYIPQTAVQ